MQVLETGSQRQGDEPEVEPWLRDPVISCYYIKNPISGKSGEGMVTHSTVLAWRTPGAEEPVGGRLWGRTDSDTAAPAQQQQQPGRERRAELQKQPGPVEMSVPFSPLLLTALIPSASGRVLTSCLESLLSGRRGVWQQQPWAQTERGHLCLHH